ncbi:hypothetical protein GG804_11630 [Sphingomonas histidinilytica]|uniref:hypothetical protein n=1 Tax=Rhizorhabdus histidinilytica TaxID=439228 RepID=UPI001ADBED5A|nr:hypothetical protein [Rhizorhabdus histidinilytica]MBO9377419.1 hypothetical protein [Rhizorhabdus histidinilytica]
MSDVLVLLANDALEATEHQPPLAAVLLIDAAVAILVSRVGGDAAREMAGVLMEYLVGQTDATLKAGGLA